MTIAEIIAISTEIITLIGVVIPVVSSISKVANGTKCQLRTEMLNMYYAHRDTGEWKEYERLNFDKLYGAYKALKGNSFIDDVYEETRSWRVIR